MAFSRLLLALAIMAVSTSQVHAMATVENAQANSTPQTTQSRQKPSTPPTATSTETSNNKPSAGKQPRTRGGADQGGTRPSYYRRDGE